MACTEGFTFMPALTYDAMLEVLSLLNVNDLGRLAQVSRETNNLADDGMVWRKLCHGLEEEWVKLIIKDAQVPKVNSADDWKNAFQQEREKVELTSQFVGLWSEKWCDVNVAESTLIESDGQQFFVTYKKNKFSARFQGFDGETMTFQLEGGDSGWSFIYKIKPLSESLLNLTVHRVHDQKTFSGVFTRG